LDIFEFLLLGDPKWPDSANLWSY